jgi:oligopeptide/dipeptide ABC transporter ATP-binding protein
MYLGRIVEIGAKADILTEPRHPYTRALFASAPGGKSAGVGASDTAMLSGDPPSPLNPPSGCRFRTRCPLAFDRCKEQTPILDPIGPTHSVACHLY